MTKGAPSGAPFVYFPTITPSRGILPMSDSLYRSELFAEILDLCEAGYAPQMEPGNSRQWQRHFDRLLEVRAIAREESTSPASYHVTEAGCRLLGRLRSSARSRMRPRMYARG